MKVEFLGTGGAFVTPRPLCECRVCVEARERGAPYSRGGPSVFVHGPDVLIDTPEEAGILIGRSGIENIGACLYSHWHPDHVMGRRVFEALNWDVYRWPPENRKTRVYLPQRVARDFRVYLGLRDHLDYMQHLGLIDVVEIPEGEKIAVGETTITAFPLAEDFVYAFLFEGDGRRLLIAMDELKSWEPPEWLGEVDLAVLPKGIGESDPLTGERRIPSEHPILRAEATFEETLRIVEKLGAKRTILSHIEEFDGLSYGDLIEVEKRDEVKALNVTFAYDTQMVEV